MKRLNNVSLFLFLVRPVYPLSSTTKWMNRYTKSLRTVAFLPPRPTPSPLKAFQSRGLSNNRKIFAKIQAMSEMSAMDNENSLDDYSDEVDQDINVDKDGSGRSGNEAALKLHQTLCDSVDKALQAKKKKKSSLLKELEKAEALEATTKRANLIVSNLYQLPPGTKKAVVQDWDTGGEDVELVLSQEYDSAKEEADALFASAKKMKRGSSIIESLLSETNQSLELLDDAIIDLEDAYKEGDIFNEEKLFLLLNRLERSSPTTGFVMKEENVKISTKCTNSGRKATRIQHTFRRFLSPGGCVVMVGRNRRDNEAICFQVARSSDIWMHSRGCPGAHVLLQVRRGSPRPTDSCLQFAANLAAFYSDARTERKTPITTASPKHILKPRGAPLGTVKLRKEENTLIGYPGDVDDSLKVAREQSGVVWDESGSRSLGGKAKNRKRTQENARKGSAKKREGKKAKRKRRNSSEPEDFF